MARFPSLSALRAFEAAARHLSFTKAAAEVCITQGAISYQIRSLEHELGVALFRRERRSVVLTSEGRRLLPALQRGFAEIEAGIVSLAAQKEKRKMCGLALTSRPGCAKPQTTESAVTRRSLS